MFDIRRYILYLKLFKTFAVSVCMYVCYFTISMLVPLVSKHLCMYNHLSVLNGF